MTPRAQYSESEGVDRGGGLSRLTHSASDSGGPGDTESEVVRGLDPTRRLPVGAVPLYQPF
jgi:hypothetical protein